MIIQRKNHEKKISSNHVFWAWRLNYENRVLFGQAFSKNDSPV